MIQWDLIDRLVKAYRAIDATSNVTALRRNLELWWALKYNRPFKDPLLREYTLEELSFEFLTHYYLDPEHDPRTQEEKKVMADLDEKWLQEQLERTRKKPTNDGKPPAAPDLPPGLDPSNLPEVSARFDSNDP